MRHTLKFQHIPHLTATQPACPGARHPNLLCFWPLLPERNQQIHFCKIPIRVRGAAGRRLPDEPLNGSSGDSAASRSGRRTFVRLNYPIPILANAPDLQQADVGSLYTNIGQHHQPIPVSHVPLGEDRELHLMLWGEFRRVAAGGGCFRQTPWIFDVCTLNQTSSRSFKKAPSPMRHDAGRVAIVHALAHTCAGAPTELRLRKAYERESANSFHSR